MGSDAMKHFCQISWNFPVKSKFFLNILVVPIIYEWGKVETILGNKTGITSYSWMVCASNFISALKVLYGLWCHETLLPDLCVWWMWELLLSLSDQDYEQSTATHCVHRVYR